MHIFTIGLWVLVTLSVGTLAATEGWAQAAETPQKTPAKPGAKPQKGKATPAEADADDGPAKGSGTYIPGSPQHAREADANPAKPSKTPRRAKPARDSLQYYIKHHDYWSAVPLVEQALLEDENNIDVNYFAGVVYLYTGMPHLALRHLDLVARLNPNYPKVSFYDEYALALHQNNLFDEAKSIYRKLQSQYSSKKNPDQYYYYDHLAKQCENGKLLVQNPQNVAIENMGPRINSRFREYGPIVDANEKTLIFTTRRPENQGGIAKDNLPFEDIWIAHKKADSTWGEPQPLTEVNTDGHDGAVAFSADGEHLIIYRQKHGGDLYFSDAEGKTFSVPQPFDKYINTRFWEPSAWMSADGQFLFYVSDKPGGFGGSDIYISIRTKDGWTEGENMGPRINTPYDEDSPFLHPDGKTFYFSSKGHNSMGGSDIFKSTWTFFPRPKAWSTPVNLGYPINSAGDDRYFVLSGDGRTGYISSNRVDSYGDMDLYYVHFNVPPDQDTLPADSAFLASTRPLEDTTPARIIAPKYGLMLVRGLVTDADTKLPVGAELWVQDLRTGDTLSILESNHTTGDFLLALPAGGNYALLVKSEGYLFHSENFNLPTDQGFQNYELNVALQPVGVGKKIVLNNIFFDFDKATLRPESKVELNNLIAFMKQNPSVRIRLTGHTDSIGSDDYNLVLSQKRALAVRQFLMNSGIDPKRLESLGKGESEPVATNETAEGRQLNRRTELEIIK